MAATARALGHEYMVLTDHSARLTIAHGLDRERLIKQLGIIALLNEDLAPFRILTGMEVDINEDGTLDLDDDLLEHLDVVVASVHSKLRMESFEMTPRMLKAIASPHVDILGHCTGRMIGRRPPSVFDAGKVFAACAETGTAVEINSRPERLDPPFELLERAIAAGCWFSIDSDAHATGQLEWQPHGCDRAAKVGVPIERIVNTMNADDLIALDAPRRLTSMHSRLDAPPEFVERLREICVSLPHAYEEDAWVGTRWCVRKKNFAHIVLIEDGWPPAYARAAGVEGAPGMRCVLTFRSSGEELVALEAHGRPFFKPPWWADIVGVEIDDDTDWDEIAELVTESYCLLAPAKLVALVERPEG